MSQRAYPKASERYPHGGPQHRFAAIKPHGARIRLGDGHPAIIESRSLFPRSVYHESELPRLLVSGVNSRKIGKVVAKGRWRDFPIFTLTLTERETCPSTCLEWRTCMGNNMNWARRIVGDRAFEERLWEELADKQAEHPAGFVVRLHILGDFYSVDYAELWAEALESYPALQIFGYTARDPATDPIGEVLAEIAGYHAARFHMRFSGWDGPTGGSIVVDSAEDTDQLICPAQTGKTDCCASCALCWHSDRTIAFLRH